jgi:hypothetical protein
MCASHVEKLKEFTTLQRILFETFVTFWIKVPAASENVPAISPVRF